MFLIMSPKILVLTVMRQKLRVSKAEGLRVIMDFSTCFACVSHASDVLGACVMITSALHSYID
jgi:hypothetical protein